MLALRKVPKSQSELKDKDINEPRYKGEHYRLTADEYSVLAKRFQINGIPHYAIANKKGVVVENGSHSIDTEKLKVKLMQMAKE